MSVYCEKLEALGFGPPTVTRLDLVARESGKPVPPSSIARFWVQFSAATDEARQLCKEGTKGLGAECGIEDYRPADDFDGMVELVAKGCLKKLYPGDPFVAAESMYLGPPRYDQ